MPLILGTNSIKDTAYEVANSLRFDRGSSASLNKTFGTPTNSKKLTISFWTKFMAESGNDHHAFSNGDSNADESLISFINSGNHNLEIKEDISSSPTYQFVTNRVFRDPSAWMHIVIAWDSSQSTESNRLKLYINGSQETSLATANYPNLNQDIKFNTNIAQYIGKRHRNEGAFFNGYMAEIVWVDGQQLAADQFGEFDSDSPNIWKPIDVSGLTFGNNGFYLDFENSGSLGADVSGNGNNFTVNNLTSVDQSTDTCTNNFATFNPLIPSTLTYSDGNLTIQRSSSDWESSGSTIAVTKGKWYAEFKWVSGTYTIIGVEDMDLVSTWDDVYIGYSANGRGYGWDGNARNAVATGSPSSGSSFGNSFSTGDIIGVALDMDNKFVYMSKNGTFQNSGDPTSGSSGTGGLSLAGSLYTIGASGYSSVVDANFGSPEFSISSGNSDANGFGNFEYSVPNGFFSLCSKNLAEFG